MPRRLLWLIPLLLLLFLLWLSISGAAWFTHLTGAPPATAHSHPNRITASNANTSDPTDVDPQPDPRALPIGITTIEGEGGAGYDRAVKAYGVWFPVYDKTTVQRDGSHPLNQVPLTIASGPLTPGISQHPYIYHATAIGGIPPYTWSLTLDQPLPQLTLIPTTGHLTGIFAEPLRRTGTLTVTDHHTTTASITIQLRINDGTPLVITTLTIPPAILDSPYITTLSATGGVPPYTWHSASTPPGLSLHPTTGTLTGTLTEAADHTLPVTLTDAHDTTVTATLTLTATGSLEITTPAQLPPAPPRHLYTHTFVATGGTPPYTWAHTSGELPPAWELSPDGILTGTSPAQPDINTLITFTLTVTDTTDLTYERQFHTSLSDLLLVVPSRQKVGLAWRDSEARSLLAQSGLTPTAYQIHRDGIPIHRSATATNLIDENLPTGATPTYTLSAHLTDGTTLTLSQVQTTILPFTLKRATPGQTADPFADSVTKFAPLSRQGYGSGSVPRNVTGPPDGRSTYSPAYRPTEVLSLHAKEGAGGLIELAFTDNIIALSDGPDLTVFENVLFVNNDPNKRFMEPAIISIALHPGEWYTLPTEVLQSQPANVHNPFYYARGFAGRNASTGEDPTQPSRSGGDSLDIDTISGLTDLTWIRFIRIQSTGDRAYRDHTHGNLIRHNADPAFQPLSGTGSSGFDLDAISAIHY